MLANITTEDLLAELKRREEQAKEAKKPRATALVAPEDLEKLKASCQDYIDQIAEDGYVDDDSKQWIFEAAMELFFGRLVWRWIGENQK